MLESIKRLLHLGASALAATAMRAMWTGEPGALNEALVRWTAPSAGLM